MSEKFSDVMTVAIETRSALLAAGIDESDPDYVTLLESECEIFDRLRNIVRAARHAEAHAKALAEMVKEMQERKARLEAKASTLRTITKQAMETLGTSKLESPDFTASIGAGKPALVIHDETALPSQLLRVKTEPDRTAIRKQLEQGETVPGASLGEAVSTLTVRVR